MPIYQYSKKEMTMTESPWITVGIIVWGFILGVMVLLGGLYWNHTLDQPVFFRHEYALAQENALLRNSVRETTSSLESIEDQFPLLSSQHKGLTILLQQPLTSIDSIARVRYFQKDKIIDVTYQNVLK